MRSALDLILARVRTEFLEVDIDATNRTAWLSMSLSREKCGNRDSYTILHYCASEEGNLSALIMAGNFRQATEYRLEYISDANCCDRATANL